MSLAGRTWHFNQVNPVPGAFRIDYYCGSFNGGTTVSIKQVGSMYWGENRAYDTFSSGTQPDWSIQGRYIFQIFSYGLTTWGYKIRFPSGLPPTSITKYDSMYLNWGNGTSFNRGTYFLPDIDVADGGTTLLFYGTGNPRAFTDANLNTVFAGTLAQRSTSESFTFTESKSKKSYFTTTELATCKESVRFKPRRYPREYVRFGESRTITTLRHGTITDWNFMPRYSVVFDHDGDGTYGTTNWQTRIKSFGNLQKSTKHWTGEYQVGNWKPTFIDENNEIYGSTFSVGLESRMKGFGILAMVADKPLTYIPQFFGEINSFEWQDGLVTIEARDKLKDLANRNFVFDYANLGSSVNGKEWGRVLKVSGTLVMFNDFGDVRWIEAKTQHEDTWTQIARIGFSAVVGFIGGGPIGAGIGAANAYINSPSDSSVPGYYKVTDYNAIPDNTVRSGQRVKFYSGSVNAIATNLSGPLANVKERSINGGKFNQGIYGTFDIDSTEDIKVGDYVYVRKPLVYFGNPDRVIKAILCGSNIDYPYSNGSNYQSDGIIGSNFISGRETDFSSNWNYEINTSILYALSKTIGVNTTSNPYREIKDLVAEILLSFYIDETDKFAIKSLRPKGLVSSGTEPNYQQNVNILSGFSFSKSIDDAIAGVRMYYQWKGEGIGAFNGYNKLIEQSAHTSIRGITAWGTILSDWLFIDDDAESVTSRMLTDRSLGVDRINLPTTLYGVINYVNDVIKVTHKTGNLTNQLFEIEGYSKNFDNSTVELTAINVNRSFGYGNAIWSGTSIPITTSLQSGFSYMGVGSSLRRLGTISRAYSPSFGTCNSTDTYMCWGGTIAEEMWKLTNNYIVIGSLSGGFTEVIKLGDAVAWVRSGDQFIVNKITRGMFNTIPRRYYDGEPVYLLGPVNDVSYYGTLYNFGTTLNIGSNIGTAFKFF